MKPFKFCVLRHKVHVTPLLFLPAGAINTVRGQQVVDVVANGVVQSRSDTVPQQDEFRLRMESQCHLIKKYRQDMLRDSGRLLSPDEAALEWIERYAATFDSV